MKIKDFSKLNVGTTGITRAYLGEVLIWPNEGPTISNATLVKNLSQVDYISRYVLVSKSGNYVKNIYIQSDLSTLGRSTQLGSIYGTGNTAYVNLDDALILTITGNTFNQSDAPYQFIIEKGIARIGDSSYSFDREFTGKRLGCNNMAVSPYITDSLVWAGGSSIGDLTTGGFSLKTISGEEGYCPEFVHKNAPLSLCIANYNNCAVYSQTGETSRIFFLYKLD